MTTLAGIDGDGSHRLAGPALVVAAWAALLAGALSGSRILDHDAVLDRSPIEWTAICLFLLAWQLAVIAVLLPANMPAVPTAHRAGTGGAAFLVGFAAVWTGFAAAALGVDSLVHRTVESQSWIEARPYLVAGGLIGATGLLQLSPWRHRSLAVRRAWAPRPAGPPSPRRAVGEGTRYGRLSLWCDGPLMFLMFGLGRGSVAWMAGIGLLLLLERRRSDAPPERARRLASRTEAR